MRNEEILKIHALQMAILEDFESRLTQRITAARNQRKWSQEQTRQYMEALTARLAVFERVAARVAQELVAPRVRLLAKQFPNAGPVQLDRSFGCVCRFGYTERFPASTKLQISIGHDDQIETLDIQYEVEILPAFLKYDRFDRLSQSLQEIEEEWLAEWVESKLLCFVDTYLALAVADELQSEAIATDPVCNMRIRTDDAAATVNYKGHLYYFCCEACGKTFSQDPQKFVWFETL